MRVTAETKEKTRTRLREAARKLFTEHGFEETATRDLAAEAGVAAGTLFNYFPTKEALALSLVAEALEAGRVRYCERRRGEESLVEDLFAHVAAGLRELALFRSFVGAVLETALSPFRDSGAAPEADELRTRHLETVTALLREHDRGTDFESVTLHLYWTLFLGVLAFWSRDPSPKQEDTLVVLDRSMELFAASLERNEEKNHGS